MPEGYKLYEDAENGFVMALPVEWITLDLGAEEIGAALEVFGDQIPPAMAEQLPAMVEQGIKLFAVNPLGTDPTIASNVNVGVYPRGPLDTFDIVEQAVPQQLEAVGAILGTMGRVELPAGEALAIEYQLPLGDAGTALGQQYWIQTQSTFYVVTFTDTLERSAETVFDAMIASFVPVG